MDFDPEKKINKKRFKVFRSYSDTNLIKNVPDKANFLDLIKFASNLEAEVYDGESVIFSSLGWEWEYNKELLAAYGLDVFLTKNGKVWNIKIKNKELQLYCTFAENKKIAFFKKTEADGDIVVKYCINDYRVSDNSFEIKDLEEVKKMAFERFLKGGVLPKDITIDVFTEGNLEIVKLDFSGKLFECPECGAIGRWFLISSEKGVTERCRIEKKKIIALKSKKEFEDTSNVYCPHCFGNKIKILEENNKAFKEPSLGPINKSYNSSQLVFEELTGAGK